MFQQGHHSVGLNDTQVYLPPNPSAQPQCCTATC